MAYDMIGHPVSQYVYVTFTLDVSQVGGGMLVMVLRAVTALACHTMLSIRGYSYLLNTEQSVQRVLGSVSDGRDFVQNGKACVLTFVVHLRFDSTARYSTLQHRFRLPGRIGGGTSKGQSTKTTALS